MTQTPQLDEARLGMERMAGTWRGDEIVHPAPWDAGGRATTRIENRLALGGQVLVQDYVQTRDGGTFAGHGVLRWDTAAAEYVPHWFDSLRTAPSEFRGRFDAGVLTLIRREPRWARASWTFDGDRLTSVHRRGVHARSVTAVAAFYAL